MKVEGTMKVRVGCKTYAVTHAFVENFIDDYLEGTKATLSVELKPIDDVWIEHTGDVYYGKYECPRCGFKYKKPYPHCPHCAKNLTTGMKGANK